MQQAGEMFEFCTMELPHNLNRQNHACDGLVTDTELRSNVFCCLFESELRFLSPVRVAIMAHACTCPAVHVHSYDNFHTYAQLFVS